jgi:hypothetical protein
MQAIMGHVGPLIKAKQPNRQNVFVVMAELIPLILLPALANVRFAQYGDLSKNYKILAIHNVGTI